MRLFKFTGATPSLLEGGQAINGVKSALWVERYQEPGEFQLEALLSSGLRTFLPIGTIIGHQDTYEVMIVESHNIEEQEDSDPVLTISGRSFEAYLEQRVVGINQSLSSSTIADYTLASAKTWAQAVTLINAHISTATDVNDRLSNVVAATALGAAAGVTEARVIPRGNLHAAVMSILQVEDLGIKTFRQNPFGVVGSSTNTTWQIHSGTDRSAQVIFSWKAGDLGSAEYLWSEKKMKNAALINGRYVSTQVYLGANGYPRRWMVVDANDIDGHLTAVPVGGALTSILAAMQVRGRQALAAQKSINVVRSDISPQSQFRHRVDYNVGDLVAVNANFGETGKLRVVEYVESFDENGFSGFPTLSVPGV